MRVPMRDGIGRLLCTAAAAFGMAGAAFAQTQPTPRSVPFTENFGAAGSTTPPLGFAAWNGLSGASVTTETAAASSAPAGTATILTGTPASGGTAGAYYYAVSGNARLAVNTSGNTTNGVNQWVMGIDTTGQTNLTLSYNLINVVANTRTVGVLVQYRVGTTGTWTTIAGSGNPYIQSGGTTGTVSPVSIALPANLENLANVQIRWAVWRGTESGSSSAFGLDDVSVSGNGGPVTGACCTNIGACTVAVDAASCTGLFFTSPAACAASPCPTGTGSCCATDGSCSFILNTTSCSGTFMLGGACSPNICVQPPVPGACCVGPSNCVASNSAAECAGLSGTYQGPNTVCNVGSCQALGQPAVVISQVYGGGGNSGSLWTNDYVELFNRGSSPVNLTGYSVQYHSATGTGAFQVATLPAFNLQPGQYFLVQLAAGTGGSQPLPTADATGSLALGGTGGQIALSSGAVAVTGSTDPTVVDFVGYGAASDFKGAPTPALSNTSAAVRNNFGCTNAGNNASDFTIVTDNLFVPRNSASNFNNCGSQATGACCTTDGICSVGITFAACVGVYLGDASTCSSATICAETAGSCCALLGTCTYVTAANCAPGETFTLGAVCSPNPCVQPTGSCCFTGLGCMVVNTPGDCSPNIGGSNFIPNGLCNPGPCIPTTPAAVLPGDFAYATNKSDATNTLFQIRGVGASTPGVAGSWQQFGFIEFVRFDNTASTNHNADGNLIGMNFGANGANGGPLYNYATDGTNNAQMLADVPFMATILGATVTRLTGLSVSPNNDRIAVLGYDTPAIAVMSYTAGATPGSGSGAAITGGATLTTLSYLTSPKGTWGSAWLDNDTLLVSVRTGSQNLTLYSIPVSGVDSGTTFGTPVARISVTDPGPDASPQTAMAYNPQLSNYIYVLSSAFSSATTNTLYVIDPATWTVAKQVNLSTSLQTGRDLAIGSDRNLYLSTRVDAGRSLISKLVLDADNNGTISAAEIAALADNSSTDFYTNAALGTVGFSGMDIGLSSGPVVLTGACCITATGQCVPTLTNAACTAQGGVYQNDNSTCTPNLCPQPSVSCCRGTTCNSVSSGTCTGIVAGSNSVLVSSCGSGTSFASCCYADFNHDGTQSIDDLFLYFNAYFTGSPWANMGGDGVAQPTIDDLFLYINAYFGTCS